MSALRIIFAGSGEFGIPTVRALHDAGHQFVQVFTQPDKPAGRGKKLTPTPIAQLAMERSLPLVRTADINCESLPPADLMVVIAFGQKLSQHVVDHPRLGSVNLHASLLPKYRGAAPINWAIINGETLTGNSVIRLAQKMDAGAIVAQSSMPIGDTDTAGEVHDRLALDGVPLVHRVADELARGVGREVEQDHSKATFAPKLSRELAKIDWCKPAGVVARLINGMSPWPGCQVVGSDRLTLLRARATNEGSDCEPGVIDSHLRIACGAGSVEILGLKPDGKREMPLEAYRNGHPWKPGMRLEPV